MPIFKGFVIPGLGIYFFLKSVLSFIVNNGIAAIYSEPTNTKYIYIYTKQTKDKFILIYRNRMKID